MDAILQGSGFAYFWLAGNEGMDKKMEANVVGHMAGCQNYGPFLGTLNIRGRIIVGTQIGTIILTTTHIGTTTRIHSFIPKAHQQPV